MGKVVLNKYSANPSLKLLFFKSLVLNMVLILKLLLIVEIGRASCRERVYVLV